MNTRCSFNFFDSSINLFYKKKDNTFLQNNYFPDNIFASVRYLCGVNNGFYMYSLKVSPVEEKTNCIVRVGWSSLLALPEDLGKCYSLDGIKINDVQNSLGVAYFIEFPIMNDTELYCGINISQKQFWVGNSQTYKIISMEECIAPMIPHVCIMNASFTTTFDAHIPNYIRNDFSSYLFMNQGNDTDIISTGIMKPQNPTMIILIGPPCSGKTYMCNLLRTKYIKDRYHVISSDDYIMTCTDPQYRINEDYDNRWKKYHATECRDYILSCTKQINNFGCNLIIDMTSMNKRSRNQFLNGNKKYKFYACVLFPALDVYKNYEIQRNTRGDTKNIRPSVMLSMLKSFQMPTQNEGFSEILTPFQDPQSILKNLEEYKNYFSSSQLSTPINAYQSPTNAYQTPNNTYQSPIRIIDPLQTYYNGNENIMNFLDNNNLCIVTFDGNNNIHRDVYNALYVMALNELNYSSDSQCTNIFFLCNKEKTFYYGFVIYYENKYCIQNNSNYYGLTPSTIINVAGISFLYIRPEYRKQSYGSTLLKFCLNYAYAQSNNCVLIHFITNSELFVKCKFYGITNVYSNKNTNHIVNNTMIHFSSFDTIYSFFILFKSK